VRHPIYTRPDSARVGDIDYVLDYAVNFDGYAYAHEHDIDIEALANDRLHKWQSCGEWQGTFEEMRLCLFVEQRLDRHVGRDPEIEAWIIELFGSLCESSKQRQGVNRALRGKGGEYGFSAVVG
jgi:hypothetical protein